MTERYSILYMRLSARVFKKRSRILLNTRSTNSPITLLFFLYRLFWLQHTCRNASSPVDIFVGTVNAHVITKHEESDPVIVNGLTARWTFFDTTNTATFYAFVYSWPRYTNRFIREDTSEFMAIFSSARSSNVGNKFSSLLRFSWLFRKQAVYFAFSKQCHNSIMAIIKFL